MRQNNYSVKLSYCPFCGSGTLRTDSYYVAKCITCGAMIGESGNKQEIIKAWNRRVGDGMEHTNQEA